MLAVGAIVNGVRSVVISLERRPKQRVGEEGWLMILRHRHYNLQPSASENMVSASRPCRPFRPSWLLVADIYAEKQGMTECDMQTGYSLGLFLI